MCSSDLFPSHDIGSYFILAGDVLSSNYLDNVTVINPVSGADVVTNGPNSTSAARYLNVNSDLSALSIRATEYLQRWKEVVQFSSKDYSDQMAAQFGIKAPEYMGNHAHYIGGWSNVININDVLNTNLNHKLLVIFLEIWSANLKL